MKEWYKEVVFGGEGSGRQFSFEADGTTMIASVVRVVPGTGVTITIVEDPDCRGSFTIMAHKSF